MLTINLTEPEVDFEVATRKDSVLFAKQLFGNKDPFAIDMRPDGHVVIFSEHFIYAYRKALSLNCVAEMTKSEKDFYFEFVQWNKDKEFNDISDASFQDKALAALDQWTLDELMGNEHPNYVTCGA